MAVSTPPESSNIRQIWLDGSHSSADTTCVSDLDELRALARTQVPLAALIAETVDLRPARADLRGACPFHPDAGRGLYVSPMGHFQCFSCRMTGDVVAWAMRVQGIDEATAIARLLQR